MGHHLKRIGNNRNRGAISLPVELSILLDVPQFGISPGQACVFYDGDRVLGGGWIRRQPDRLAA